MNFINGKLVEQGSGVGLEIDTGASRGVLNLPFERSKLNGHVGREVILGLRPERITDARNAHDGQASSLQPIDVVVDVTEPTGPDTHVFAQVNGKRIVSRVHPAANPQPKQQHQAAVRRLEGGGVRSGDGSADRLSLTRRRPWRQKTGRPWAARFAWAARRGARRRRRAIDSRRGFSAPRAACRDRSR